MFCGTSAFRRMSGDDPPPATKCSRKKKKKQSKNKNPYSSRGLDKFTSVLSELEARREKIMATTGAQGIAMIRFVYSNSQDWIPVIVRLRDENTNTPQVIPASAAASPEKEDETAITSPTLQRLPPAVAKKGSPWWKWRPDYCMPVMMVLMLVCLVIFGRVFAICCTSIWWYLAPTLPGEEDEKMRRRFSRKKDYVKKISNKMPAAAAVAAPSAAGAAQAKTIGAGVKDLASPRAHGISGKKG